MPSARLAAMCTRLQSSNAQTANDVHRWLEQNESTKHPSHALAASWSLVRRRKVGAARRESRVEGYERRCGCHSARVLLTVAFG